MPRSLLARAAVASALLVTCLAVVTQVPLVPSPSGASGLVPLDTWLAGQFPAARDIYRAHLARVFEPWRLPALALLLAIAVGAVMSLGRLGAWLAARVPPLSPLGLGAFRCALGVALMWALSSVRPPTALAVELQRSASWFATQPWIRELASTPGASDWLRHGALAALACFAAGLFARQALVVAAVFLTGFVGVLLTAQGTHDWDVPLVTLWLLTLVPWNSSAGVGTWWAHRAGRALPQASDVERGFAVWVPGLMVGLAFAAAAFAKLDTSGAAWVLGGAVRFHFIEDANHAPTTWGLTLTHSDAGAIVASLGAIVVEAVFWVVTLCRRSWIRFAFGLSAVTLLSGFYLFQGVFWPAWWALLISFLPWPEVDTWLSRLRARLVSAPSASVVTSPGPDQPTRVVSSAALGWPYRVAVVSLLLIQVGASLLRVESEPWFSDFAMYAYTWPSKEAFSEHLASKTRRLIVSVPGQPPDVLDAQLHELSRGFDVTMGAVDLTLRGEVWPDDVRTAMTAVREAYRSRYGEPLGAITVSTSELAFDWEKGAFASAPRVVERGIVDLEAGRFR